MKKTKSNNYSLTYPKIVAIGFALIIILGTALLLLPISSKTGDVSIVNALFTATSATCVTGLVPFDTYTSWTVFGQIVILCLIQIGGLGFITVISFVMNMLNKKSTLKEKMLLKEAIGSLNIGDVKALVKSVVTLTVCSELAGAVILSFRFVPLTGSLRRGIYVAIFTSVSAYCNAGFDLMGGFVKSSSLTTVNNDPIIILTISALIIIGGLGFIVWNDMRLKKFKAKAFAVHTKLVLTVTSIILVVGTVLFFVFEFTNKNTFADMPLWQKLLNAFFANVTTRTAGFNSVDTAAMTPMSKLVTMMLMFIGGSSGSTAGGVKTTSIAILILCVFSTIKNKNDINVFSKRVDSQAVKKAISIVVINFSLIFIATVAISLLEPKFTLVDILFECTSAIGTVGMTLGITPHLSVASKIIVAALMYVGRLTSLIFALMFLTSKAKTTSQKPVGVFVVG